MVATEYDVVVVGAGADGPVTAWKLGELGLDVLVLEAGPFHGNEQWPNPHEEPGGESSDSVTDLSGDLLDEQFTTRVIEMSNELMWGPADHEQGLWVRKFPGDGVIIQCAGVGGTTLMYMGNHPRAYPAAIDEQGHWPIDYEELIPYYETIEEMTHTQPAPVTAKEELFFQGAAEAGWGLLTGKNVTEPGYRPQPNAIKQPDPNLHVDNDYDGDFHYPEVEGSTLAMGMAAGNPHPRGAPFEKKARQASNISFVPPALETGNVEIRPNSFVTDVTTDATWWGDGNEVTGVEFRDTWSDNYHQVEADVVVLAAGTIETPRLWKNSGLPDNDWVGNGLTLHFGDKVIGLWEEDELEGRLGKATVDQHHGQNVAARFDYPGLGMIETVGTSPGLGALVSFGVSSSGFTFQHDTDGTPWDSVGRLAGRELKEVVSDYRRMVQLLVLSDDRPHKRNGVSTVPGVEDEHGSIPQVNYKPSDADIQRRDELSEIAADILREAGASHIHRSESPPMGLHLHSTMRMGKVVDEGCEANDIDRLFIADHSVLANGIGGPNPTATGQALALRTAESIYARYFA